ncbi:PEP-CTERM sorting domain-containing protein [Akkermansia muciniphila]|uniref:PEP-CTERM sorting domain-containing protein n=1 Tax=Akkermansia muciniphila TaxID=239935 RepID=UPI001650E241|nr:PEP-CTERM sorting domain-containing protein [Akkermansia muciniphila]
MKFSTFISLLAGGLLQGSAVAATTIFTDLSQSSSVGDISYTSPEEGTVNGFATGAISSEVSAGGERHPSSVTLSLNLSAMRDAVQEADFSNTLLVDLRTSESSTDGSIGLMLTTDGLKFSWQGNAWSPQYVAYVALDSLQNLSYTVEGSDYVTLTLVAAAQAEGTKGTKLLDAEGEGVVCNNGVSFTYGGLTSTQNYQTVLVNTKYITGMGITPGVATPEEIVAATRSLAVPEPATASLSLLGLVALMARRRRRD